MLADAIEAVLPGWVVRSVERLVLAYHGRVDAEVAARAREQAARARAEVGVEVRALLRLDVDDQRDTPLAVLRRAVRYPTEVLRDAGVPDVERDEFKARLFPDDPYDLTPSSWADVDESLTEPGLAWGAWKAMTHRARHTA